MKIAIDVSACVYEGTGVATYYNNLIPKLIKLAESKKHTIIPFGYSLRNRKKLHLAKKKLLIPPSLMEIIWNRLHIFPVENIVGPCDLVHAWDYIQPPTRKAKIITTIHDLTPLKYPNQQHPRTIRAYNQGLKWVKKYAQGVIADSLNTKQDIIELLDIPEEKVSVVYLAAPESFHNFESSDEEKKATETRRVKDKYHIDGEYLLFVGTREPRKNLQNVVAAFHPFRNNYSLVIAGNVGWGKQVQADEKVNLIGYVQENDLPALFSGAACFVYPSLYEGFGIPVVEAMAVGCPVVTSDRGSLAEVVGEAAVVVNPEKIDAIAFGITSALNNRKTLQEKGITRSKEFSWDLTAEFTLKAYERIVTKQKNK